MKKQILLLFASAALCGAFCFLQSCSKSSNPTDTNNNNNNNNNNGDNGWRAKDSVARATNAVHAIASDANLYKVVAAGTEIDSNGACTSGWEFQYYSAKKDTVYAVMFEGIPGMDPVVGGDAYDGSEDITPIPAAWINSDSAMHVANKHGASAFLMNHPSATQAMILWKGLDPSNTSKIVWYIMFDANDDSGATLVVYLDAVTAQVYQ